MDIWKLKTSILWQSDIATEQEQLRSFGQIIVLCNTFKCIYQNYGGDTLIWERLQDKVVDKERNRSTGSLSV